jgi:hypothetical protein
MHAGRPALGGERPGEHRGDLDLGRWSLMDRPRAKREIVMRALVYHGPGVKAWEDVPKPEVAADTGALKVVLSRTA